MPESVYANISDSTMFKDVTQEMKDKLKVENNGSYKLDIEKLEKSYVIHYDGEYLWFDQVNFRTHMFDIQNSSINTTILIWDTNLHGIMD